MIVSLETAIWLLPVGYMLHDLEEIVIWRAWMGRNAPALMARLPIRLAGRIGPLIQTGTPQISLAIFFLFALIVAACAAAVWWGITAPMILFGTLFVLHGFGHIGQTVALRTYTPGIITTVLVVLPFGALFFPSVLAAGLADVPGLVVYGVLGLVLMMPLILGAQALAGWLYPRLERLLVPPPLT